MKRSTHGVKVLLDRGCPAPGGVRLSTDVYLPEGPGPWPCVLVRTPYNNNDAVKKVPTAREFARNGYAYVIQDVRGRYDSEGTWEPFFHEAADGHAAQAWCASEPWCNGKIALLGRSYEGYAAWMGAFGHHPAVKAIVPICALPDPVVNVPWQNGSVFWNMIEWSLLVHGRTVHDVTQFDWPSLYTFRPLSKLDEKVGFESAAWRSWLRHPVKDDFWMRACYMHRMGELDLAALHVSGWYDDDGVSTWMNYPNARRLARSRDDQYLLVGPWPHATNTKSVIPGVDFGPNEIIDLNGFLLDWLDLVIGDRPGSWGERARARVFLMGSNDWHDMADWPPPGVEERSLYLRSGGRANSFLGDGVLGLEPSGDGGPCDSYRYDPDDPTPYLYDPGTFQVGGPFDARPVQRRDDVLCYTSAPLSRPLTLCGRVFAELWVSSSAEDTEFCAMLCDVHPNGLARQLSDGNARLAMREGLEAPDPVPPGGIAKVRVDMWATGIRVLAGHRIRLQVSSAAVPKLAAHTNTLEPPADAVRVEVAENRVHHTPAHPSRLLLPVLDGWESFPSER